MYEFSLGRAAIVTEIYLPAKYGISPDFLNALDGSLLAEIVQLHFSDRARETRIRTLLPPALEPRFRDLSDGLAKTSRSFGGYSVYDLKGAWTSTLTGGIERDANLCVRLIDWPDPRDLFPSDEVLCQQVIRTVFALRLHHVTVPPATILLQAPERAIADICAALDEWIDQGSLLLYGYLMFHLLELTGGLESEVLLTSHFGVVNQYRRDRPRVNAKG